MAILSTKMKHPFFLTALALGLSLNFGSISDADLIDESFDSATFDLNNTDGQLNFSEFSGEGWYSSNQFGGIRAWGTFADKGPNGVGDTSASLDFDNEFAGGLGYVISDANLFVGSADLSFDYLVDSSAGQLAARVWGVTDPENDGWSDSFQIAGGSGNFGAEQAAFGNYAGADATELLAVLTRTGGLAADGNWNNFSGSVDLGTGYDYLIVAFGATDQVAGNTGLAPDVIGIDNVVFSANAVPEPSGLAILLGCTLLSLCRRQR